MSETTGFEKTLMEKEGKKTPQKEGLKIRHYIMNLIYRHPKESVMIPSSKELAKMFGVARSTVTLELKALVAEHYLEGKRGIGTFTRHLNFIPVCGWKPETWCMATENIFTIRIKSGQF